MTPFRILSRDTCEKILDICRWKTTINLAKGFSKNIYNDKKDETTTNTSITTTIRFNLIENALKKGIFPPRIKWKCEILRCNIKQKIRKLWKGANGKLWKLKWKVVECVGVLLLCCEMKWHKFFYLLRTIPSLCMKIQLCIINATHSRRIIVPSKRFLIKFSAD